MHRRRTPRAEWAVSGLLLGSLLLIAPVLAQDGPAGLTQPVVLPAYDPHAPDCAAPPGLGKSLGFAQDNARKFIEGVGYGLERAAKDPGLSYQRVVADNDPVLQAAGVHGFIDARFGAIIAAPVDPASLAHSLQQQMWNGGYVGTIVPPPATTILNAPQYLTGKALGDAAADYIRDSFGGKADVVLLTQDSLQFLAPRFAAIRDALKDMPGVSIVADLSIALPILKLVGEVGQVAGGSVRTYNTFSKDANASRLYGSVGLRLAW